MAIIFSVFENEATHCFLVTLIAIQKSIASFGSIFVFVNVVNDNWSKYHFHSSTDVLFFIIIFFLNLKYNFLCDQC